MARKDFATATGGYDPNEIVTKSQDHHGHSTNQRVHIPPTWRAMIEQIVQSPEWPEYTTLAAFVRDSMYHRLHWTTMQKDRTTFPGIKRAMIRERYRNRLTTDQELETATRAFRNDIEESIVFQLVSAHGSAEEARAAENEQ